MEKSIEINENNEMYYKELEQIRRSGVCNMWGASTLLMTICPELTKNKAREILLEWIENYDKLSKMFGWRENHSKFE